MAVLPAAGKPHRAAFLRSIFFLTTERLTRLRRRSQRGEPAAQRPSSSTSSPLPPLSPVQIPLVGRGVLTAPNTFTSTGGGVGTHRPTKWNRSKQSKQRCPIPLCVPLRPLWLKKKKGLRPFKPPVSRPRCRFGNGVKMLSGAEDFYL